MKCKNPQTGFAHKHTQMEEKTFIRALHRARKLKRGSTPLREGLLCFIFILFRLELGSTFARRSSEWDASKSDRINIEARQKLFLQVYANTYLKEET